MGIDKSCIKVLIHEKLKRPFSGKILTLGKQGVSVKYNHFKSIAKEFNLSLDIPKNLLNAKQKESKECISDEFLFKFLGFEECHAMDISDFEGANNIFDLNQSNLPSHLNEKFDVIIDGGTIEHVFHIPNALNNIFKMLKQGGRIIHFSPSSNYLDHGFYMFSPTIFSDFYSANNFEINELQLFKHSFQWNKYWEMIEYVPGNIQEMSDYATADSLYAIFCVATKTQKSTGNKIPMQFFYTNQFWPKMPENVKQITPQIQKQSKINSIKKFPKTKAFIKRSFIYKFLKKTRFFKKKNSTNYNIIAKY